MAPYLISYDIAERDAFEYGPLWDKLKSIGAKRILYSEWVLVSKSSATDIFNAIAP